MTSSTTSDAVAGRVALLRRETALAGVINAIISIGFFLLVFGWSAASARAFAIDFLPQTFGITMLGGVVPSFLTLGRVARGEVIAAGSVPSRTQQAKSILLVALVAVTLLGGAAALTVLVLAPASIDPLPAVIVKALYGALVGLIVTPPIIRMALGMPFLPARRRPMTRREA